MLKKNKRRIIGLIFPYDISSLKLINEIQELYKIFNIEIIYEVINCFCGIKIN